VILAIAVALDALVVRLVLLPVVLRLGGHSAWHQPKWLGHICQGCGSPTDWEPSTENQELRDNEGARVQLPDEVVADLRND